MKKILIIGATSEIAEATARLWAAQGHRLALRGRDGERLRAIAVDLGIRGAGAVDTAPLDVNDFDAHADAIDAACRALDGIDIALIAHGTLGDQKACERDFRRALRELDTNAISVISLLTHLGNRFEAQRHGTIAVIGSVAGDRGRQSNYVYGAAKGAVAIFLQGLRNRLHAAGVQVLTIKPGFVDTRLTRSFAKGPLWVGPGRIAADIVSAIDGKADVVYTPFWWRYAMLAIRAIPERLFKTLRL